MSAGESLRISAWYLAWTIPGILLPGFFLFLPFGALIFPPIVLLAALLLTKLHRTRGPEILGVLLGIGLWGFLVAYFNRDSNPCPESGFSVSTRPGESFSCGGVAPEPFLIAGVLLALTSILGAATWMLILQRRSR